jgi:uncharacterized protein YbbC (DUF1343 family)
MTMLLHQYARLIRRTALGALIVSSFSCQAPEKRPVGPEAPALVYRSGAEQLVESGFAMLRGKRIGLLVNHTARLDSLHLSDVLHQTEEVELVALFAPEHGIRGDADAGEVIEGSVDQQTGVPVFSLYGESRKPSPASLAGLDALVFDIQDIGARFYTYISSMGLAMQAAAEAGISFVVLDRPNPLGGEYVSGYLMEPAFKSFVGQYPIPVAHGLTVGELAQMIKGEGFLEDLEDLDLQVVKMEGWKRAMLWPETSQEWRPTSPNIPDFETALVYPGTCFFEAVEASEGRGTLRPFLQVGAPWIDTDRLMATLKGYGLEGIAFESTQFTPHSIEGMASNPRFQGELQNGVRLRVTDAHAYDPLATGIYLVAAFYTQAPSEIRSSFFNQRWMTRLGGTEKLREQLEAEVEPAAIVAGWQADVDAFKAARAPYLIYE